MCGICGCGQDVATRGARAGASEARGGAHVHAHEHGEARRIRVEESILADNQKRAEALVRRLDALGIEGIGLLGGPGSGKTTLLEATLRALSPASADAVIEGDCASERDAARIAQCGVPVAQIETGSLCHLDAHLVEHALDRLELRGVRRLWIENVGNLVCPAPFACGESRRAVLISTAEGDDKPEKYPAAMAAADLLVISKLDLLPHVDFDPRRCAEAARRAHPGLPVIALSARNGEGMEAWLRWVRGETP